MQQLLAAFLCVNVIFIVARYTSRLIERQLRRGYWYLSGKPVAPQDGTKVLRRHKLSWRQMTRVYLDHLSDTQQTHTDMERVLWRWYQETISAEQRAYDPTVVDALPRWLETLAWAYNDFWCYNTALLVLFFALSLATGPLWMPLLAGDVATPDPLSADEQWHRALREATGREMPNCACHEGEYCYASCDDGTQPLDCVLDRLANTHCYMHFSEETDAWRETTKQRVRSQSLASIQAELERLHQDEVSRGLLEPPCICAPLIGVLDNVTLLYRPGASWLVMPRPAIQRVNAGAQQVRSTVRYHFNSRFFATSQEIARELQLGDVVHYNTFIVEYDAPARQEVAPLLHTLSERVAHLEPRPLLMERVPTTRHRVQLTGNDAICYIYCDSMNERVRARREETRIN